MHQLQCHVHVDESNTPFTNTPCMPYIDPQNHPNVGIYGIHGVSGIGIVKPRHLRDDSSTVYHGLPQCPVDHLLNGRSGFGAKPV